LRGITRFEPYLVQIRRAYVHFPYSKIWASLGVSSSPVGRHWKTALAKDAHFAIRLQAGMTKSISAMSSLGVGCAQKNIGLRFRHFVKK